MEETTIAAISTAMSASGIGIVRISGPEAFEIASGVYRSKGGKKSLKNVPSHTIHYGYIYDNEEMVDEVLVMTMRGPRTYTGEDTIEIDCHGGVLAMKKVLETVLKNGAIIAEPGEFTKRAFLNGRIDLSQAEAVMDVIQSKNEYSLKNSVGQLKGSVRNTVQQIREKLLYHIAYIESALDDPEHYDLTGYSEELEQIVAEEKEKIQNLLKTAGDGKIIQEGIRTVILGKPNAGKSSLLNLLLGEDRAIVTDIAGTTRDVLEEYINLHGITLKIADTAGIRQTEDIVEKIGVSKAKEMAADADLILYVVDSSVPLDENDEEIIKILQEKKTIVLYSKTDLESAIDIEDLKSRITQPVIPISAKEETGITDLEEKIREMFFSGEIDFNDEVYITNERHRQELLKAQESDGGFSLSAGSGQMDVDITAMALTALAPYYEENSEAKAAADLALSWISEHQESDGGFCSSMDTGTESSESCAQVLTALCSLGIDPQSDSRFIKNGNTVLDNLMSFRQEDGGFVHAYVYDASNPASIPDESDFLAGGQAAYALTAFCRYKNNMKNLFNLRPEKATLLSKNGSAMPVMVIAVVIAVIAAAVVLMLKRRNKKE